MAKDLLNDKAIRNAKPTDKDQRLNDGGGLYMLVKPNGAKWWRFDYTIGGKRKTLSLGTYPDTTLANARTKAAEARNSIANGTDPSDTRKATKAAQQLEIENTKRIDSGLPIIGSFEQIAREWWEYKRDTWTPGHADRTLTRLVNDVFPYIGRLDINIINAPLLLETIRRIENRGAIETARRANQSCDAVFSFAIGTGRGENNPASAISAVLKPVPRKKHFSRLKDKGEIAGLLQAIDDYKGYAVTRAALKLLPMVFVRPGELVSARWCDVDLDGALWVIPSHIKKQSATLKQDTSRVHVVPLSRQAVEVLNEIRPLTGFGDHVFVGSRSRSGTESERHITIESLLAAIRRMGYSKDDMTTHGFRGIFSTIIREVSAGKFRNEVIESQMSHAIGNKVEAAYNHAEYLEERSVMMQWWSDYLDGLKAGAQVIPFKHRVG